MLSNNSMRREYLEVSWQC